MRKSSSGLDTEGGVAQMTFNGLTLKTAPGRVMTPRRTSERLVAAACAHIEGPARVADVGTGSGALAIAIAHCSPEAEVWATDIDERAVVLARANVARLGLAGRVFVLLGDLLEPVPGPVDIIVANLPYLAAPSAADYPDLAAEPFNAVFAAGDGLHAYRRLLAAARTKLAPKGTLLLQLHGQVVVANRAELLALSAALAARAPTATQLAA
jgi:release factor glutamine methyltransferase